MLKRPRVLKRVRNLFRSHPAVAIEGPRQCGKTTVAHMLAADEPDVAFFDLEREVDRRKLDTPEQALSPLRGLVVIDEAQRMPELFPTLRVLLDRPNVPARFLLTGSASPSLVRGLSESLAGRVGLVDLSGFDLQEVGSRNLRTLWLRGGFPRSYLADDDAASMDWRENFIRMLLERDLPQLGITIPATTIGRFWTMLAHYHGQNWNAAELARSLGADEKTARRYLDVLAGAFMVRPLPPWFENLKKRQVKAPKVYVRDTGLLHALLGVGAANDLLGHPKLGASWEGFAVEQLLACFPSRQAYFWATHGGAELDLLLLLHGKRYGFECKFSDAPGTTRSMHVALADLSLEHLWILYPGTERYVLDKHITALPASEIPSLANAIESGKEIRP
ncbi:MAG: ATP-binding protein [Verrucomicrobia bacterium]|nr:ATP-binding protein [Verrucomicrobiota bacterium]